jgi:hypothetical protein
MLISHDVAQEVTVGSIVDCFSPTPPELNADFLTAFNEKNPQVNTRTQPMSRYEAFQQPIHRKAT